MVEYNINEEDNLKSKLKKSKKTSKKRRKYVQHYTPTQLRYMEEVTFKTEICKHWDSKQSCKHGFKCKFAHGIQELKYNDRNIKKIVKVNPCIFFHTKGHCKFGSKCFFLHTEIVVPDKQNINNFYYKRQAPVEAKIFLKQEKQITPDYEIRLKDLENKFQLEEEKQIEQPLANQDKIQPEKAVKAERLDVFKKITSAHKQQQQTETQNNTLNQTKVYCSQLTRDFNQDK